MKKAEDRRHAVEQSLKREFPGCTIWVKLVDYGKKLEIAVTDPKTGRRHEERVHIDAIDKAFIDSIVEDVRDSVRGNKD